MASSFMPTRVVTLILVCIKMCNSYSIYLNPQADLTLRSTPENFVLRVPTSEAVAQHIALATQASDIVRQTVPHELDIRYGDREQQLLDIYGTDLPPGSPIFLYVHGGGWSQRQYTKNNSAYPVLPLWRAGVKVVVGDYDLAPNVTLEVMVEEIRELAMFVLQMAKTENCRNVWIRGHSAGAHLVSNLLQAKWYNRLNPKLKEQVKGVVLSGNVWFGGHSAGGHLVSELLQAKWYNSLNPELKERFQGVVLISGIYDLIPFLSLEINSVLHLDRESAVAVSPVLSKGVLRVPHRVTVFLITAQQDSPLTHNQAVQYYAVIKKQPGINTIRLNVPGLDIDHFSNVINLQYPNYLLTRNIISLITRSFN